jgi:hypothetical protein
VTYSISASDIFATSSRYLSTSACWAVRCVPTEPCALSPTDIAPAHHQTCPRQDSIIGAEHASAQPVELVGDVGGVFIDQAMCCFIPQVWRTDSVMLHRSSSGSLRSVGTVLGAAAVTAVGPSSPVAMA